MIRCSLFQLQAKRNIFDRFVIMTEICIKMVSLVQHSSRMLAKGNNVIISAIILYALLLNTISAAHAQNYGKSAQRNSNDGKSKSLFGSKQSLQIDQRSAIFNVPQVADFSHANLTKTVRLNDLYNIEFIESELNRTQAMTAILNLSYNNIENIDESILRAFSAVQKLDLAHNKIEKFNLSVYAEYAEHLEILNLTENELKSFDSSHVNSLKVIDLSSNLFNESTQIRMQKSTNFEYVDLSCNHFKSLRMKTLKNLTKLTVLNLAGNHLSIVEKIDADTLVNIEVLILSHNNIHRIAEDAFLHLSTLRILDLSHNNLSVDSLHALQTIPGLTRLSVAYNKNLGNALQGFVTSWSIKELDVSGTGLSEIPAALAQSINSLNLSGNHFVNLRCGDLDSYPMMQNLDLSYCNTNDIEDDVFGRLEILTVLNIHDNHLLRVPSNLPSSLVYLNLKNNQIADIRPSTFQQLTNLKILDLSGNTIFYIPGLPLPKLMSLNLRSAHVKGLSQSLAKMSPALRDIYLDGNPVKCSELLSIVEWASPCRLYKVEDASFDRKDAYEESFRQSLTQFYSRHLSVNCSRNHLALVESTMNQSELMALHPSKSSYEISKPEDNTRSTNSSFSERFTSPTSNISGARSQSEQRLKDESNVSNYPTGLIDRPIQTLPLPSNKVESVPNEKSRKIDTIPAERTNHISEHDNLVISELQFAKDMNKSHILPFADNPHYLLNVSIKPTAVSEIADIHGSSTFRDLSIAIAICCFFAYMIYLFKRKRQYCSRNAFVGNQRKANIEHLLIEKLNVGTVYSDLHETLW